MKFARLALSIIILALFAPSFGQSLQLSVSGGLQGHLQLALLDQPISNGRASLGVHYGPSFGAALQLRNTTTFGPIGNVILDFDASYNFGSGHAVSLAARGSAGPVALRLRGVTAAGDTTRPLRPVDPVFQPLHAPGTGAAWSVQLGATYRLNRGLQLLADPTLLELGSGPALLVPLEAQFSRLWDGHDLRLALTGLMPLGESAMGAWGAGGVGLRINRARASSWNTWLLFGAGPSGFSPGLRLEVQESLNRAGTIAASLQLEPYRTDQPMLQLGVDWTSGSRTLPLHVWFGAAAPAARLELGMSVAYPL